MPRETKVEREAREAKELKAQLRAQKSAEKKAAKEQEKSNVVVVDFSEDTKTLLRELIKTMTLAMVKKPTGEFVSGVVAPEPKKEAVSKAIPEKAEVPTLPKKDPELFEKQAAEQVVSLTKIREAINDKAGEGKTANIVHLLGQFGAQSASTLPEINYNSFYGALQNL